MVGLAGSLFGPGALRSLATTPAEGPYIDMHTHLGQQWWKGREGLTAAELLRWMDRHNVAKAVVLPLVSPESWGYPVTTAYVLNQTKGHRDRLIPFCAIDPRTINLDGVNGMVEMLRRYIDAGAKGFGEHKTGIAIDDSRNMRLYEACANVDLPVLFHLDNHRNFDSPGLPGLEKVLKSFSNLPFIGHAQGWWANIADDVTQEAMQRYPTGRVRQRGAIDRLMDNYSNIYGDLSAGSGANAIARDLGFGIHFLLRRSDRILFGTDYLSPGQDVRQYTLLSELMKLPPKVKQKIYRGNAQRLINFQ